MKKLIVIDGNNFNNLEEFYDEISKLFTDGCFWGRNLDAFSDILMGGFGVFDEPDEIKVMWINCAKSKIDLGYSETLVWLNKKIETCHPSNINYVKQEIYNAQHNKGNTLFDIIVEIISEVIELEMVDYPPP